MARSALVPLSLPMILIAVGMTGGLPLVFSGPAMSQSSKTLPTPEGRKGVIAGIKEYERGKLDQAVSTLSAAISAGGLSSQDLAKALYFRGKAYQKSNKSAEAIADLTSAMWIDGGLTAAEQQVALETRGKAYTAVGLSDPGPPVKSKAAEAAVAAGPSPSSVASGPSASPSAASSTASSSSPTSSGGLGLGNVGSFFSNLFSGGGSQAAQPPTSTASITQQGSTPPAAAATPPKPPSSAVSAWTSETQVALATPPRAPAPAATPAARPQATVPVAPAAAKAVAGRYRLQVAAVRSRAEAERLVSQLSSKHGSTLGGRSPDISETVFGNMGTFYQVNVGPFQKTSQTDSVCQALKADGYDCLVVLR